MSCVRKDSIPIKMDNSGATSISIETQGKYEYFKSHKINALTISHQIIEVCTQIQNFANNRVWTFWKVAMA